MRIAAYSRATFLSLASSAIALAARPKRVFAQASKVRMAGIFADAFAEPFYGKEAGIWAQAGFDADISSIASGNAVIAAIAGGSLDLGISDLTLGGQAFEKGVPIDLIGGGGLYRSADNATIIAVRMDSPIRGLQDLAGKTLAVPTLSGQAAIATRAWIAGMAGNDRTVNGPKLVELSNAAAIVALQNGTIDATLLFEPFLTPVRSQVRQIGRPLDAIAKEFLQSACFANRAWVEADHTRAKRFVDALYDVARWSNTHRAETMQVLVRDGKLDGERVKGMVRTTYATSLTPSLVQPVLNIAAQQKVFAKEIDAASFITRL